MDDLDLIGAAYLSHLTEADLLALVHADEVPEVTAQARLAALRRAPELLLDVLDRPAVSAGLLNLASADSAERFTLISPFLVFAAAIHRIAADLQTSAYAPERTAPRLRVPVFDGPQLAAYLASAGASLVPGRTACIIRAFLQRRRRDSHPAGSAAPPLERPRSRQAGDAPRRTT